MSEENRDPEIKVTDRRRFSAEGEPLDTSEAPEAQGQAAQTPPKERQTRVPLPPATFEFLVLSLSWQAELQLGLVQPQGEPPDLEGARHSIDLLGVLQEKTKGNLTWEEQRLLENTLTELRFRYVQAVEARKPG